jgi:hypothetical protein
MLAVSGVARAQPPATPHDAAVASFEEGTRLVTQGNCQDAIGKFRESLALEPLVGARLDLADCEERLGAPDAAWIDFRLAERLALARGDDRSGMARARAAELESKLQVVIVPPMQGLELRVDGHVVDPDLFADGSLAVAPGAHLVEATAGGHTPVRLPLTSAAGGVVIALPSPPATPAPTLLQTAPAPSPAPQGSTRRTLMVGLLGLGVIGIAAGSFTGAITLVRQHEAVSACGGSYPRCDLSSQQAVTADNDAARMAGTISTVSFTVGGLALAGGALLYLTTPARGTRTGVSVTPMIAAGTGGAALSGSW